MFKIGDEKLLIKPTFLYKGVFVFQNSPVRIKDYKETKNGIEYQVEYMDREGNIFIVEGIREEELI